MKLSNVLFGPSLKCNLVSIAKLCKELNSSVTFFHDFCLLQDCTLRMPIGLSEQQHSIYYFKEGPLKVDQVNAVNSSSL